MSTSRVMPFQDIQKPVRMGMDEGFECFEKAIPRVGADPLVIFARRPVAVMDHYGS